MKNALLPGLLLVFPLSSAVALADTDLIGETSDDSDIEVVLVTGVRIHDQMELQPSHVSQSGLDNSDLMRMFPGGNRNANGPLTRISQYRGLAGAQNNVLVNGAGYSADCPNWMDTPLSSIPQSLTESVTLYRGLASVKTVQEGLGNGIAIRSRSGDYSMDDGWSAYGSATAGYGSNASSFNGSLFAGFHNADNWIDVAGSTDTGDDYEFDGGTALATEYDRKQYRLGYGRRLGEAELTLRAAINRTGNAGTPALPMDMRYLDSEQYSFELKSPLGPGRLHVSASTLSVDHIMDNFTLRPVPLNLKGMPTYRESAPLGETHAMALSYLMEGDNIRWEFGLDGKWESHDHPVNDPTKPAFFLDNFVDVERDRLGLFGTVSRMAAGWDFEAGLRFNRVSMDAGKVGGNLAIPPASPMYAQQERLDELAADFNAADRSATDDQWSGLLKASRDLDEGVRLNLGLGRKARSPSYQERYLWLPMTATAGLADGYTYIGDLKLKPETSIELTAGIDWSGEHFQLTPEVFWRDVSNFIQGIPSSNDTANRFALASSGKLPLQYGNVDAELYGFDMGYEWRFSGELMLRGTLSYVRGKRSDGNDNLYRIPPLTSVAELIYQRERWFVAVESVAAARQDRVADYNDEQETAGWGVLNLRGALRLNDTFTLGLGAENLFDKVYRDHLGGYNRVRTSDIPVGERIVSMGRNIYLKLDASW